MRRCFLPLPDTLPSNHPLICLLVLYVRVHASINHHVSFVPDLGSCPVNVSDIHTFLCLFHPAQRERRFVIRATNKGKISCQGGK